VRRIAYRLLAPAAFLADIRESYGVSGKEIVIGLRVSLGDVAEGERPTFSDSGE